MAWTFSRTGFHSGAPAVVPDWDGSLAGIFVADDAVAVQGIAADAHFASYTLGYGAGETPELFTGIATSTTPVWGDALGSWDSGGLTGGVYTLRLTVIDKSGNATVSTQSVTVTSQSGPLIVSAAAMPSAFMPDHAGLMFAYTLSVPATVQVLVLPPGGNRPLWRAGPLAAGGFGAVAGANSLLWNGKDDREQFVLPGQYTAIIAASAGGASEKRLILLNALASPEFLAAQLGSGGGGSGAAGGTAVPQGGSGVPISSAPGPVPSASGTNGGAHDNGWHEGGNPNGFTIDHPDKSNGQGNNHH